MKFLIPSIISVVVGSLFSWAYLTAYGLTILYFVYLSMMIGVVFLAADAWRNRDKWIFSIRKSLLNYWFY